MQLGIRLHDVNAALPQERQTLEARARTAREEGFCCVHLALSKCISGVTFEDAALTERVRKGGEMLDIELADHIIIGDGCYFSFRQEGLM